jgi:flavin-binding protein dodecin
VRPAASGRRSRCGTIATGACLRLVGGRAASAEIVSKERQAGPPFREEAMSVAKVIELTATSSSSFEDAIKQGISRASKTLKHIEGAWIKEQKVIIKDGQITGYRVDMMVTFVLDGGVDD